MRKIDRGPGSRITKQSKKSGDLCWIGGVTYVPDSTGDTADRELERSCAEQGWTITEGVTAPTKWDDVVAAYSAVNFNNVGSHSQDLRVLLEVALAEN